MSEDKSRQQQVRKAKRLVRVLVEHHFGTKPVRVMHQAGGLTNLVFTVHVRHGDFVVRVSPDPSKLSSFMKEQWAIARAREAGVPTPEVLEVGSEVIPMPYMISRKMKGLDATFHPERMKIVHEMGKYAAVINSIPTTGFGATFEWSQNQLSHNETWHEFLQNELRIDSRLQTLESCGMLEHRRIKTVRTTLEHAADKHRHPVLNHGDLRLKNILVDQKGKIVCILDWEHCTSNLAPEWEASVALHDLSIDEKQEFLCGYGLTAERMSAIAPAVKAINIVNYAPSVERHSKEEARLEKIRMRLRGDLDLFCL